MDSSGCDGIGSPALSPENDDYANALSNYDELAVESAKRFEAFGEADATFKDLQENLHKLLLRGDALWDKAIGSIKGSSDHQKAMEGLKETTGSIRKLLSTQGKTLETLYRDVGKASRGLARLSEATAVLRQEATVVQKALEDRINEMKACDPGISPDKKTKASSSKEESREHHHHKDNKERASKEKERVPDDRPHQRPRSVERSSARA